MSFPLLPYFPVYIDTDFSRLRYAATQCLCNSEDKHRQRLEQDLIKLWTTEANPNYVLPLLSVRTGFDLFLRVMNFSPGSEVIMSAINIPDMVKIVVSHGLVVVPIDISIDTLEPKVDLLPALVSHKTVAIMVAHIYGRMINMQPIINSAAKFNLMVVEDCAECFSGFDNIGHPSSDLALFSFGVMKNYTSFGGSIGKVRDKHIYDKMLALYRTYELQTSEMYLKKVIKYGLVYYLLHNKCLMSLGQLILTKLGVDYMSYVIKKLRGFPDHMLEMIRRQPSTALLATMLHCQRLFWQSDFALQHVKGLYFMQHLPAGFRAVGDCAHIINFWLFPVLVDDVETVTKTLKQMGVDVYRGSTQLSVVESSRDLKVSPAQDQLYPHQARFLIDHVLYLPVHKLVPFSVLCHMLRLCFLATESTQQLTGTPQQAKFTLIKSKL